jgi:thymidylate synthase
MTLRKTALKSCMDEILWIHQRKSNNIKDLKPNIWDEWADEDGSIGKAYGYQVAKKYIHHTEKISWNGIVEKYGSFEKYCDNLRNYKYQKLLIGDPVEMFMYNNLVNADAKILNDYIFMDQMDAVLYDLKNNPFSRRIKINLWDVEDLIDMNLQPCCYDVTFNVTDEGGDKLVLNMTLNQRSQDILAANNWNVCQYAILLMMVAQVSNMIPGQIMHCITDAHIYDKHVDLIKELITRPTYPAPKVSLNPDITDFYKFTTADLIVEDYQFGPQIKDIPIAI